MIDVADVRAAQARLAGTLSETPCPYSETLSALTGARVFVKLENLQMSGSFKERGAANLLLQLGPEERGRGVVAASAGNHGLAVAFHAQRLGLAATIVMPEWAPLAKVTAARRHGATVVLHGENFDEAYTRAREIEGASRLVFVHPFDDPRVIAGQGTIGLELADEIAPDAILVQTGGGGLIAGIAVAIKSRMPGAEVIGVEAAGSPQLSASLAAGAPVSISRPVDTIADGLATGRIGRLPFELIRDRVSRVVTVDDFEIGEAVLLMLERMKLLAEGAGATALAGALKIKADLRGKRVVVLVSGGNIDINLLDRIIGHGLAKAGRLVRLSINLHDRPGELQKLLVLISETGANVRTIEHDRTRRDIPIASVRVQLELETRSADHIDTIRQRIEQSGYAITIEAAV